MGTESDNIGDKDSVTSEINSAADSLKEHAETLRNAIDDTTEKLSSQELPFTHYASELSEHFSNLSDLVENSSLDNIAASARDAAKNNPTLFVLGGIAAGFALARFLKAEVGDSGISSEQVQCEAPNEPTTRLAGHAIRSDVNNGDA